VLRTYFNFPRFSGSRTTLTSSSLIPGLCVREFVRESACVSLVPVILLLYLCSLCQQEETKVGGGVAISCYSRELIYTPSRPRSLFGLSFQLAAVFSANLLLCRCPGYGKTRGHLIWVMRLPFIARTEQVPEASERVVLAPKEREPQNLHPLRVG